MKDKKEGFRQKAALLDEADPLKDFRAEFKTSSDLIYFDGNSLGMMPHKSEKAVHKLVSEEWGQRLIRGWNDSWWNMPQRVASRLAGLLGAYEDEIAVCDSTSVNLFKLVSASLARQKGRKKILSDNLNFPSDLYVIQGIIESLDDGHYLELAKTTDGISIHDDELIKRIDENTALVVLTHVSFRSAFMYDMKKVTEWAHNKGALVIWDLSHAAGAVEINLDAAGADMAVGCTYKYLNGGPGSPAFLYVNRNVRNNIISPLWAWLGEKNPFEFSLDYRPGEGASRYMTGSPTIISMSTLEPSLDILLDAGMERLREKSLKLSRFLVEMYEEFLVPLEFRLGSPIDEDLRGSHISICHKEGFRICKALIDSESGRYEIIPDFRPPENIRIGLAPLYNTFFEVYELVNELERIISQEIFEQFDTTSASVT